MTLPFRDINVQAAPDQYIFTSPSSPNAPALSIDRPSGDIRLGNAAVLAGKRVNRVSSVAGILGVISLRLGEARISLILGARLTSTDKYVIVITKAAQVGRLKGHMVYKVVSTELLPLRERQIRDPDEDQFLGLLKNFIKSGPMFFSYSIDLTNSFQRQVQHDPSSPLWTRADDRFFWNRFIQSELIDFRTKGGRGQPAPQPGIDPYILPVIFGVLEIRPTVFKNTPLTLVLISRRSRFRGGTRYFTRGLDEEGNAANYNETEQILILNDNASGLSGFAGTGDMQSGKLGGSGGREVQVLSFVQTRGSVPVLWAEVNNLKYTPKVQIRSIEAGLPAARAHFEEQVSIYGDNYLVNLVNQKGREAQVKKAYEQMVETLVSSPKDRKEEDAITDEKFHVIEPSRGRTLLCDRLHYIYFDYHSETQGMQMHRAMMLIDRMHDALIAQQYFRAVDMPASNGQLEVRNLQTSVVRTNCMDCLDRTNVVQSMLARWTLDRMFIDLGIMEKGSRFADEDASFESMFRNLWADNADTVAKAYTGTGAMKTDVTRLGMRTKAGALQDGNISVTRYCRNNFFDGPRQDAFDLFLGVYQPATTSIGSSQVFADRRPILIQSVPYVAAFSLFLVLLGLLAKTGPDSAVWTMRFFLVWWTAVAGWCIRFIISNGTLYVNWPKLVPRPWATEGYHESINKVRKDKILGSFVANHERGLSTVRYSNAEEGKKRIE